MLEGGKRVMENLEILTSHISNKRIGKDRLNYSYIWNQYYLL